MRPAPWWFNALVGSAIALVVLLINGCGQNPQPRGSSQDQAAAAGARADATVHAADAAEVDAAQLQARADELERQAKAQPTEERIKSAADARVAAAAGAATATALRRVADAAAAAARSAAVLAQQERDTEHAAQDYRSWLRLCRVVGLSAVVAGALLGALIGYLTRDPRAAGFAGGALVVTGCLAVAFGPATAWLPWAVPIAGALSLTVWAIAHHHGNRVKVALSRTVDALEGQAVGSVEAAKKGLHDAIEDAGASMRKRLRSARAAWKVAA